MICYDKLEGKPNVLNALTGLKPVEFEELLGSFESAWQSYVEERFIEGKKRQRAYGGGRRPRLDAAADKLLFILFYFRQYPTQEVQGFFFGLSQGQANEWIQRLTPLLNQALGREAHLPERRPKKLEAVLRELPSLEFFIDGTERPINRPKDPGRQKQFYSGKKKRHTIKNNLITGTEGQVLYLSATYEGKKQL